MHTGEIAQQPKHATVSKVNNSLSEVSPGSIPNVFFA